MNSPVVIRIAFYSYFKDFTGCAQASEEVPAGSTLQDLLGRLAVRFPRLAGMDRSLLVAVGVEYRDRSYVLRSGDEVSLFPPVQGG